MTFWRALVLAFVFVGGTHRAVYPQGTVSKQGVPLDGLYLLKDTKTLRVSSYDTTGRNKDWITIAPGETKSLFDVTGTGVIRRFYMAPLAPDRMRYRKLVLRMYWDGERNPSVEVPLGDFFGAGLGTLRYIHSRIVDINKGPRGGDFDGMVNYFPMPFRKGARITLENDGKVPDFRLWYHIDYERLPDGALPANAGTLHAQWRRVAKATVRQGIPKNTTNGADSVRNLTGEDNFLILDAEGQGSYVGLFLIVDNVVGGWYGEGDDMIFVDGARWPPTLAGTGHEEVFSAGCCPDEEFWGEYTGFYLIENLNRPFGGKNQMYKFYVNDPVRFHKSLGVTIEHGHANNFENDYTSTAFWYQKEPHKAFPPVPSARERLPSWPEGVAASLDLEARLATELSALQREEKVRLTEADSRLLDTVMRDASEAFRALHYEDYQRDVATFQVIVERYRLRGAPIKE